MRLAPKPALALTMTLLCGMAAAGEAVPVPRDPWVPPAVRQRAAAQPQPVPTRGPALQAQVEHKLQAAFAAADTAGTGRITREQARAAGLGAVAEAFDRIDAQGRGSISFDDLKHYLHARGAATR